jgi:Ca2+-transporting ATPase
VEEVKNWHAQATEEAVKYFNSNAQSGLTDSGVNRQKFGANILTQKKETSKIVIFLLQFHQPLIYILLVSGVVTIFLKEYADAAVILASAILNSVIGYIQEVKAVKSLKALSKTMSTQSVVLRGGVKLTLDSKDIVCGDIVLLASGDKVPADIRIIESKSFMVNEAAITGESAAAEKSSEVLPPETLLADRKNMVYASTLVTYGRAKGIVTATGDNTEIGKISRLVAEAASLDTPLTIKVAKFSTLLLWLILGLCVVTYVYGVWLGRSPKEMFLSAIALAVAAIPEGLPAALTITLAVGVVRMVRRKAIVRKLPAVETLGSTTVICSDKTGTLTENKMTVLEIFSGGQMFNVSGTGYNIDGEITYEDSKVNITYLKSLAACLKAGVLCNDAKLVTGENGAYIEGDPTEGALLVSALKASAAEDFAHKYKRLDSIPFESEYQYMATLDQDIVTGRKYVFVKGSLEKIIKMCGFEMTAQGEKVAFNSNNVIACAEDMASRGLRVLAFAVLNVNEESFTLTHNSVETGLEFLGLQAMMDPPRAEVIEAVRKCHNAGIKVKMITGDHALTASAIAKTIGIGVERANYKAITGDVLASASDAELIDIARDYYVFARVAPEEKLRLVRALQSSGDVVAMTGDGVNDAPALKQADIGIAMGITGTEVAKEAAVMVLADDNFATIEAAVEEGRGVFDNIRKFILWTLPVGVSQAMVVVVAIILNRDYLPILPAQILWVNMATAVFLGVTLAFEPKEKGIMDRPPTPELPIIDNLLISRNIVLSVLIVIGAFIVFDYELATSTLPATERLAMARSAAVSVFIVCQSFYLLNCRSIKRSFIEVGVFSNPMLILGLFVMALAQLSFVYVPFMNKLFRSAPMSFKSWCIVFCVGIVVLAIISLEKTLTRLREKKQENK